MLKFAILTLCVLLGLRWLQDPPAAAGTRAKTEPERCAGCTPATGKAGSHDAAAAVVLAEQLRVAGAQAWEVAGPLLSTAADYGLDALTVVLRKTADQLDQAHHSDRRPPHADAREH
jgi:hypothetical protein